MTSARLALVVMFLFIWIEVNAVRFIMILLMSPEESETYNSLSRWHQGDPSGIESLLERHLPWIQNRVRMRMGRLLRQRAETNDYVQDAVVEFMRYGPKVVISDDRHFRALMVRIVENTLRDKHDWYMACRRRAANERPLPADTVLSLDPPQRGVERPSQAAQLHENESWIRLGLELLEPKDREILVLKEWERLTFVQIGERLGISQEAAWKRHHRAMNKLAVTVGSLRRTGIDGILGNERSTEEENAF